MFEHKNEKILPRLLFVRRMATFLFVSMLIVAFGLGLGVLGYHYICGLNWIDAILNAAMILTGMGPVNTLSTDSAKIFASFYALFSGVVFLSTIGIVLAPIFHRVMHRLHLGDKD